MKNSISNVAFEIHNKKLVPQGVSNSTLEENKIHHETNQLVPKSIVNKGHATMAQISKESPERLTLNQKK